MEFIVALFIVASCFSCNKAQISPDTTPPSLKEAFVTAFLNKIQLWPDFAVAFNVSYVPADAAEITFDLVYEILVKHGMKDRNAASFSEDDKKAVYDTVTSLTPKKLANALAFVYFDQLKYGNELDADNVLQRAQRLMDTHEKVFSKTFPNSIKGLFDVSDIYLTPYNLYSGKALEYGSENIAKYLYLASGASSPA